MIRFTLICNEFFSSLILQDDSSIETNGMYELEDYEYKTPHFDRCRRIFSKDPAHNIRLNDYTQNQVMNRKKSECRLFNFKYLFSAFRFEESVGSCSLQVFT